MRDYVGPLLDSLLIDESDESYTNPPPSECGEGWAHTGARADTIFSLCLTNHIRLVRRKMSPTHDEIPGVVQGRAVGGSHKPTGQIILALQLDTGEVVGVDVSNPRDWAWEVTT